MVPSIYGENMFDEFFDNNGFFGSHSPLFGKNSKNLMKTDIRETDDAKAYRFAVELPGFKKDEISLDIKDGYLTIAAQKGLDKDEQDKKGRVLRQPAVFADGRLFSSEGGSFHGHRAEKYSGWRHRFACPYRTGRHPPDL